MEIKEKGVPSLRNVYDRVKQEVIKEKWKPLKVAKNISFHDAKKDWMETRSYDTFLEINKEVSFGSWTQTLY